MFDRFRDDCIVEEFTLAVIRDPNTGQVRQMTITRGNPLTTMYKYQTPPDGRPGKVDFDEQGRIERMVWFDSDGREHREGAPSFIRINPDTGIVIVEEYSKHGERHRSATEPALICRDPDTGEITETKYFIDGKEVPPPPPATPALKLDLYP